MIKTVKTENLKDSTVELRNWYIGPSIASPFPQYEYSNRTWDKWGEDTFGMDGELYSIYDTKRWNSFK